MSLLTIPQELLDGVASHLSASSTLALSLTCRGLSDRLARALHNHAIAPVSGLPAVHWAIKTKHMKLARYLLCYLPPTVRLQTSGRTPLHTAAETLAPEDLITLLIDHGADINAIDNNGQTPLHLLCDHYRSSISAIRHLLDHGADIDAVDQGNRTPLAILVLSRTRNDCDHAALFLLQMGAKADCLVDRDETALMMAARQGRSELLAGLLAAGAEVDYANFHGSTALLLAAQVGCEKCIRILIEAGAALDGVDGDGDCAVGLAVKSTLKGIAVALVKAGARWKGRNAMGVAALVVACQEGYSELVEDMVRGGVRVGDGEECEDEGVWQEAVQAGEEWYSGRISRALEVARIKGGL